jgi:glutamate dehydrogenase (NAD(P)+)
LTCDVRVPVPVERVIDANVAQKLKCRILAEGANGPTTPEPDLVLEKRQDAIFVIPDICSGAWWSAISNGCRTCSSYSGKRRR